MMKIAFFGTPEFAATNLVNIAKDPEIQIVAIITQPDQPVGRKQVLTAPPVKKAAESLKAKLFQPKNKKELQECLEGMDVDFFVVIAYGMIFPKETLEIPHYGAINVHASLLPKYRGASPIQEALLHGDEETGVSIMKMDREMDHGDVFFIKRLAVDVNDNLETLTQKLADLSSKILPFVLRDIQSGEIRSLPQNHSKAIYCKKISKEDGKINFKKTATEIKNMIRAYTPWPGVYTQLDDKKFKILSTLINEENIEPGKFIFSKKELKIGTKSGTLLPQTVQLEGKNPMKIDVFLNGRKNI